MTVCTRCNTEKSIENFSKDKNRKSGRYPYCKECVKNYARTWYAANQPRESAKRTAYTRTPEGRANANKWKLAHLEKHAAIIAEWQRRNPEKVKAANDRYNKKNPQRRREISKHYRARNPEKVKAFHAAWREANRERFREMGRQWALNNPHKARAKSTRYAAMKLKAVPAWADDKKIKEIYQARFAAEELFEIPVHIDHVVPLRSKVVCGLHCEDNLRLMPARDNQLKSNREWPDMWGAA